MTFALLGIAFAVFCTTLLGGLLALTLKDKLHLILGFSAGAVIALAFFDLLPESIELGSAFHDTHTVILFAALGFFTYLLIDRFILTHKHADEHDHVHYRGRAGASALSGHSFFDGVAVGLAFQASPAVGAVVAIAVLTHDFSDGINTVNMILKNGGTRTEAFRWLLLDAIAPVLGMFLTLFFTLPESTLSLVLATFAGFFLYIGAADLLPESHHAHPKMLTTVMTLLGALVLYTAISFAH